MTTPLTEGRHAIQEKQAETFVPLEGQFDIDWITGQLETYGFEGAGRTFTKSQRKWVQTSGGDADDSSKNPTVLTVTVSEERLTVKAEDVVGVVSILPRIKIEIEPKVGWGGLVDMLLTVLNADPADQPQAAPIRGEDDRSVSPVDVIVIFALNYHRGLQTIQRRGLIRDIIVERTNSYEGVGTIDLAQTLRNHAKGEPVPNWLRSRPEYDNTVNALLHFAGKQLLYFLKEEVSTEAFSRPRIERVFNLIHEDVKYLESQGVTSHYNDLDQYARFSIQSLPRQRRYYNRALYIAQALLTSSLVGRDEVGPQHLLIDYVLQMENFFEDYSQELLERALDSVRDHDPLGLLDDVSCKEQDSIEPFSKLLGGSVHHRPDHTIEDEDRTIAVLDSKYYQEEANPVKESSSRSRIFAYAYLKEPTRLAFLCPLARTWRGTVEQTSDELQVVSVNSDTFDHWAYREAIETYLREVIDEWYPEIAIVRQVETGDAYLCIDRRIEDPFEYMYDPERGSPFSIEDIDWFIDETVSNLVRSPHVFRADLEGSGSVLKHRLRTILTQEHEDGQRAYPQHETTCLPIFQPPSGLDDDAGEGLGQLTLFLLQQPDEPDEPTIVSEEHVWVR